MTEKSRFGIGPLPALEILVPTPQQERARRVCVLAFEFTKSTLRNPDDTAEEAVWKAFTAAEEFEKRQSEILNSVKQP